MLQAARKFCCALPSLSGTPLCIASAVLRPALTTPPRPSSSSRSGGIQLCWPQYGSGPLQRHGFLQNLHWSVVETAWRQPDDGQQGEQLRPGPEGGIAVERPEDIKGLEQAVAEGHDLRPIISLYADTGAGGRVAFLPSGRVAVLPSPASCACWLAGHVARLACMHVHARCRFAGV